MPSVRKQGTESFPKMAAPYFGLQGFLSATVSRVANLFVPYRTATREFHSSCSLWEELPRKPRYVEPVYGHVQRLPLIRRNPTKIVAIIWIILTPIAIGAFFLTKEYIEKKRLRVMKRQREMNSSSQRN